MKKIIPIVLLFVFGCLMYILTLRGNHGAPNPTWIKEVGTQLSQPFELSPERGRYLLLYSLVENHSFSLSPELAKAASPDVGVYKGKYYVFFAPGISIFAIPLYVLGKTFDLPQVFAFFTISLFAVMNLIFIYLIAKDILRVRFWAGLAGALTFGFASSSWNYAITMYQHHVTAFFILSSIYMVWRFRHTHAFWKQLLYATYVWIAYSLAISIDYPNLILFAPVATYLMLSLASYRREKLITIINVKTSIIISSVVFVVLMGIQGYVNLKFFGSPFNVTNSLIGIREIEDQKKVKTNVKSIAELEKNKTVTGLLDEKHVAKSFTILTVAVDKGIFVFSPIFILGILGIIEALKKHRKMIIGVLLGVIGANLFVYSSFGDPWGGWAFGPRYLIVSMSVLSIFVAYWLNNDHYGIFRKLAFLILFVVSSAIGLVGALTTNQIPPKVEADYLKMGYNYLLNFRYLFDGRSSSYLYKEYISHFMTLPNYFLIIWGIILIVICMIIFVLPVITKANGPKNSNTN